MLKIVYLHILLWASLPDHVNSLAAPNIPTRELQSQFWINNGMADINRRLNWRENTNIAKNVILFIGDGLGGTTVTAARILKGQLQGEPGEESVLKFEEFPNVALSKVYNVDRQTPDSAGTATAFLSGVKTRTGVLGVDPTVVLGDCEGSKTKHLDNMMHWAMEAGKKVGIVSTARITHATPAAAYAYSAHRDWEGDVETVAAGVTCDDIAKQLIDQNPDINVLLGGGRRYFLPNTTVDPETGVVHSKHRQDGRNLIEDWKNNMASLNRTHKYVWNKVDFDSIDDTTTDYVLGLFEPSHMQYELDRVDTSPVREPSIAEMTSKAIKILSRNSQGYFLYVEGARIDHAHHDNVPRKSLHDTLALEEAIKVAVDAVNMEDTLIITTADHSHVFDITGHAYRGTDILGLSEPIETDYIPYDDKPYSVLMYANGPGYNQNRRNLSDLDIGDKDFVFPSGVPMDQETHSGEDVMIYADGPMAHLFYGVHEQSYIAHVMAYSACVGPYRDNCSRPARDCNDTNMAVTVSRSDLKTWSILLITLMLKLFL